MSPIEKGQTELKKIKEYLTHDNRPVQLIKISQRAKELGLFTKK